MIEEWRDVPNYIGYYKVSSFGNLKSLDRIVRYKNNGTRFYPGREIRKSNDSYGYEIVRLSLYGVAKMHSIHSLVAQSFLGHKKGVTKLVVDHINNIPDDNRLENLQLITHRENLSKDKGGDLGVYENGNRWCSKIHYKGESLYLGTFKTKTEAKLAYKNKLNEINKTGNTN